MEAKFLEISTTVQFIILLVLLGFFTTSIWKKKNFKRWSERLFALAFAIVFISVFFNATSFKLVFVSLLPFTWLINSYIVLLILVYYTKKRGDYEIFIERGIWLEFSMPSEYKSNYTPLESKITNYNMVFSILLAVLLFFSLMHYAKLF